MHIDLNSQENLFDYKDYKIAFVFFIFVYLARFFLKFDRILKKNS